MYTIIPLRVRTIKPPNTNSLDLLCPTRSNTVLPGIILLFSNAASIIIRAGDQDDGYPFDMFYFASTIIQASN